MSKKRSTLHRFFTMSYTTHTTIVSTAWKQLIRSMGPHHSEAVYHRALVDMLYERHIPSRVEVLCPFIHNKTCVGWGRADIVIPGLIIEVKCMHFLEHQRGPRVKRTARQQLIQYMQSLNAIEKTKYAGMVLGIDSDGKACTELISADTCNQASAPRHTSTSYIPTTQGYTPQVSKTITKRNIKGKLKPRKLTILQGMSLVRSKFKIQFQNKVPIKKRYIIKHLKDAGMNSLDAERTVTKFFASSMRTELNRRVTYCSPL